MKPFASPPAAREKKVATFHPDAIARAEAAVVELAVEFEDWMADELQRLLVARAAARTEFYADEALQKLHDIAHDIKGVGATYNYPLATLIAKSLCTLLESEERRERARAQAKLIHAHVDAIRAVVDAKVRSSTHSVGAELLAELQRKVDEAVSGLA